MKEFLFIYLILSCTVGAYFLAKQRCDDNEEDVTLLAFMGSMFPAIFISAIWFVIWIGLKIKLSKYKPKK